MTATQAKPTGTKRPLIRRILLGLLLLVLVVMTVSLIFLGEIVEWQVEKRDVEFTGREINLEDVYINILSGEARIDGLTFYEADNESAFVTAHGIVADINPWQLFRKRIVIEEAGLNRMVVRVSHRYREFNYDDLLDSIRTRFIVDGPEERNDASGNNDWWWGASNIYVDSCRFEYSNLVLESTITADPFNVNIPAVSKGVDTVSIHSDLGFIKGGKINLDIISNLRELVYDLDLKMDDVPIDYLYLYLRDYLKVADFGGYMNTNLHAHGSIENIENVVVNGTMSADELRLLDNDMDTVFALGKATIELNHYDNGLDSFDIGSVFIYEPYLRFELYPEGDNLTDLLTFELSDLSEKSEVDSITRSALPGREYFNVFVYLADYISMAVETYNSSSYRIDSVGVFDGTIFYGDYTLDQEASFLLTDVSLTGTGFNTSSDRVNFAIGSNINNVGRFDARWSFNPHDVLELELQMVTTNFLVSTISPYSFQYTAYPFTYGDALYEGSVTIRNRKIESSNHLFVEDMEVGRKGFADPPVKLPLRLAVSILKDLDGNIDLDIPVEGDLDDPKFKYWPAVWKVLKNTLVKIATAPYRLFAGMFKVDEDDLRHIPWVYGQRVAEKDQIKRTKSIAKVLNGKPELALTYTPVDNVEKEMDYIALFAAKEQFYRDEITKDHKNPLTAKDTIAIGSINVTDSLFYQYLKDHMDTDELMTSSEMARHMAGGDSLRADVKNRIVIRDSIFHSLLVVDQGIEPARIVKVPRDSLEEKPDTLNLIGPIYMLGFKMYDAPLDSLDNTSYPEGSTGPDR